jgi:hypothetical protein
MNGPRRFGFLGILVTLAIALIAGAVGYAVGLGASGAAPAAGPYVYPPFSFGFGLFGFLFFLLLFGLLIAALVRPGRHGGPSHWPSYGAGQHGPWDRRDLPPFVEPMLESWHRRAHGETDGTEGNARPNPPAA